jgi:hypothetical protein
MGLDDIKLDQVAHLVKSYSAFPEKIAQNSVQLMPPVIALED